MTTITFNGYPTQTDRYRERLYRAVVNQPGINRTELARSLGYLDGEARRQLMGELIATGRVEERAEPTANGRTRPGYWPLVD